MIYAVNSVGSAVPVKQQRVRRLRSTDATLVNTYLFIMGYFKFNQLPQELQDRVYGASRQLFTGDTPFNPERIYGMFLDFGVINTRTVGDKLNRKRDVQGLAAYSTSMIEYYTNALSNISNAIFHWMYTNQAQGDLPMSLGRLVAPANRQSLDEIIAEVSEKHCSFNTLGFSEALVNPAAGIEVIVDSGKRLYIDIETGEIIKAEHNHAY